MDKMVVKKAEAKQCLYCRPGIMLLTQANRGQVAAAKRISKVGPYYLIIARPHPDWRVLQGTARNVPTGSSSAVVEHPSRYLIIW